MKWREQRIISIIFSLCVNLVRGCVTRFHVVFKRADTLHSLMYYIFPNWSAPPRDLSLLYAKWFCVRVSVSERRDSFSYIQQKWNEVVSRSDRPRMNHAVIIPIVATHTRVCWQSIAGVWRLYSFDSVVITMKLKLRQKHPQYWGCRSITIAQRHSYWIHFILIRNSLSMSTGWSFYVTLI